MAIRLSGMQSGLDTESIVSALVTGYKTKKEKYQKAQTKLSWTQDAWKDVNKKVYSLYSGLDSLRFSSGYALKKTTVSDPSKVNVSASGSAFNGTQKLKIKSTATTGTLTGAKLGASTKSSTKLAELGFTGKNGGITLTKGDGSTATFTASQTSTVGDFVNFLKNNGLSANYDDSQKRIYVNAKTQGAKGDFSLTASNSAGFDALTALGVNVQSDSNTKAYNDLAQYAVTSTDAQGNHTYSNDANVIKSQLEAAIGSYNDAGKTITDANVAIANLGQAYNYATNYVNMRESLTEAGLDYSTSGAGTDNDRVNKLLEVVGMSEGAANNSILDSAGNIYYMAGGNVDGDTVYSRTYKDGDEEKTDYITEHYTGNAYDINHNLYTKSENQVDFGSADNKVDLYEFDGKKYRMNDQHKLIEIEEVTDPEDSNIKYYQDKEGAEAFATEPEIKYYTGQTTKNLSSFTDAEGKVYMELVDDNGEPSGIYKNGDKYFRTDGDDLVEVTKKKDGEGNELEGMLAENFEDVTGDDALRITGATYKADADFYYAKNDLTSESSGTMSSYKWVDDFFENETYGVKAHHNDWDDARLNSFRDKLLGQMTNVADFEAHEKVDELYESDGAYAEYSVANIMQSVHDKYETGQRTEVETYSSGFGSAISSARSAITTATETREQYSNLSTLAAMNKGEEGSDARTAYDNAINAMVERIQNAVDILSNSASSFNKDAAKNDGTDAVIELGGIEYTSANNSFNINGLSIQTLNTTAEGEEITINTSNDTQGIYDKVKDFISNYNDVINELTELYNASSSKGYDPLTEDEKAEMTDKQVEQWESKIKDSLLRRDQNLGNIITTLTGAMSKSYTVNGKNYSLASFGIKTQGILRAAHNHQNEYHIDGDEDDTISSSSADKLMAMLTSDPEVVTQFMQQLTNGIHNSLEQKMRTSTLSSAYTIYNDKEMASEYSDYTKMIKTWETRMEDAETRYTKQFSKMESALAKLNSNSTALTGMLG